MIAILLKYWKQILLVIAVIALIWLIQDNLAKRKEINRISTNMAQITAQGERELNLTKEEYKNINTAWSAKLDSVLKDNKIKLRNVQAATIVQTVYRDTGSTKIIYKDVIQLPDKSYRIPLVIDEKCWGVKGNILTVDPLAKLEVTEKTTINSIQLLVVRKRFLGFLWYNGKTDFKAFNDCGEVDVTKIDFKK